MMTCALPLPPYLPPSLSPPLSLSSSLPLSLFTLSLSSFSLSSLSLSFPLSLSLSLLLSPRWRRLRRCLASVLVLAVDLLNDGGAVLHRARIVRDTGRESESGGVRGRRRRPSAATDSWPGSWMRRVSAWMRIEARGESPKMPKYGQNMGSIHPVAPSHLVAIRKRGNARLHASSCP